MDDPEVLKAQAPVKGSCRGARDATRDPRARLPPPKVARQPTAVGSTRSVMVVDDPVHLPAGADRIRLRVLGKGCGGGGACRLLVCEKRFG